MRIPTVQDVADVIQRPTRTKFLVPFTISGKLEIFAKDEMEAAMKFAQMDVRDLAEEGELQSFDPEKGE